MSTSACSSTAATGCSRRRAGASVAGQLTGGDGHATVTFASAGVQHLKATRGDAVRSNDADVCVYVPGSGACGHGCEPDADEGHRQAVDHARRPRDGASYKRGPRELKGTASDDKSLFQVYFRLRRHSHGGCSWYSSKSARFTRSKPHCTAARYQRVGTKASWSYLLPASLPVGKYVLDEKALDSSFNVSLKTIHFEVKG